jgi:hypothetical protein
VGRVTNAVVAARGRTQDRAVAAHVAAVERDARIRSAAAEAVEALQARREFAAGGVVSARAVRAERQAAVQLTLAVGRLRGDGLTLVQIAELTGLSLPETKQQVKRAENLAAGGVAALGGGAGGRAGE